MATALYRRYRPESFAEVIGQDHVTTPLRRALRAGRVGHAYLFSGPRGCGKTTSARILARCLNCEQGPTDTPCGHCDSCRDLARGGAGSLDVVEIDAASHGGVDDARELRERASFAPVRDRFKVFIIDEAHMVTSAGFNALLKLVEEPPEHVKFVFATTEPDKVIGTIRSRTHHYPFRLIPPQVLAPYLEEVCAAEGVQVGEGVMPLVVRAGGGSARDSMSVLDQLMAGAGEDGLDFPTAIALLGFTDTALLDSAIIAVAERDAASLYAAVEHVLATGHEPRRFVEDLLERMRDLIVLSAVPDRGADLLPQVPADELERMRGQATMFAPADLSQCGDLVHETLSTMSGATSPRLHLELLAARLVLRDERAALAAPADGTGGRPAPAQGGRGGDVQGGRGAPAQGAPQGVPGGAGGREEARRIAQEKAEASRQARSGGAPSAASTSPEPPGTEAVAGAAGAVSAGAAADAGQQPGPAAQEPSPQTHASRPLAPQDQQAQPPTVQPQAPETQADQQSARQDQPAEQQAAPSLPNRSQQSQPPARQDQSAEQQAQPQPQQGRPPQDAPGPSAPGGGTGGLDPDEVRTHWSAILDELAQIRRPSWALISQNGHVHGAQGSTLVIGFRTDGLVSAFHRGTAAENLADAVRRIMHTDITVEAVVGEGPGPGGGGRPGPGGPGGQHHDGPQQGGGAHGGGGHHGGVPQGAQGSQGAGWSQGGAQQDGGPRDGGPQGRDGAPAQGGPEDARTPAPDDAADQGIAGHGAGEQETGRMDAPSADSPSTDATPADPAGPSGSSAPDAGPVPWGDAVARKAPPAPATSATQEEEQPLSAGQRASERAMRAAARASEQNRGPAAPGPDRSEDFAPEPDDPFPPDPRDSSPSEHAPRPGGADEVPQGAAAPAVQQGPGTGRWSDALAPGPAAAPARPDQVAPAVASPVAAPPAGGADDGEIPVVDDEGRDSLPPEEPRTYGQAALKRAIAEGRVIRSRPAQTVPTTSATSGADGGSGADHSAGAGPDAAPAAAAGSDAAPEQSGWGSAPSAVTPGSVASPSPAGRTSTTIGSSSSAAFVDAASPTPMSPSATSAPTEDRGATGPAESPGAWGAAATAAQPAPADSAAPAPTDDGGPAESASSRAAASWGTASIAPATGDAPVPARSGAALVREAAQASRTAGQRARSATPEDVPEADPTGGATRDDEDAVVAQRNGREIIESVLGGKVLEVIDETETY